MIRGHGVVYDAGWQNQRGEVVVSSQEIARSWIDKIRTGRLASVIGSAFIVAGLAGLIFTFRPIVSAELSFRWEQMMGGSHQEDQVLVDQVLADSKDRDREIAQRLAQEWGISDTNFSVYIPKIGAKAKILENVDPGDQDAYMDALSEGVAHAAGSSFPGAEGGTYLFAHSTNTPWNISQYNAVFYLLRELSPEDNDEIYIFFLDKLYKYRVSEKHVVDADDISWLVNAKEGSQRLILQTCWPPGTTWKRSIVVAEPVL